MLRSFFDSEQKNIFKLQFATKLWNRRWRRTRMLLLIVWNRIICIYTWKKKTNAKRKWVKRPRNFGSHFWHCIFHICHLFLLGDKRNYSQIMTFLVRQNIFYMLFILNKICNYFDDVLVSWSVSRLPSECN